ncbi:MAG TPA: arylesterase [Gemmatimonadaceae bacterium]|nr:arylesterase [Gemmatimonadaceae bacterium]
MWSQRVKGAVLLSALAMACGGRDAARDTATSTKPPSPAESPAVVDSAPAQLDARRTILFLGTSLTAGLGLEPDSAYPQQIQRKIDASKLPYQVVNAGVSGETSAGLLRRLDWVLRRPADVVVVETGANDGLRGLPVDATRATIANVLARIRRERPDAKILLVQMEAPPNLGPEYTSAFHAMFPELAREHGVSLLPFLLEGVAGEPRLNQSDGIHPNNQGERIVAENVWRVLQPMLKS